MQAWLSGIVNVYEPWTRSKVVPPEERALAGRRIRRSRSQLGEIAALHTEGSR
ncbi:hypothetical protein GCM10010468_71620 [Actinocorallia longicatena]|uniref:Uncharacterized protein n=1 Tax=Actinocorallia longicatena TaxID=111803 RepID=A0ABP6QK33_9ACTN